jgi:outer membrane protein assembly factor BamA
MPSRKWWRCCAIAVLLAAIYALAPAYARDVQRSSLIVESLRCEGNVSTSCRFILNYLYLKTGDRLDDEEIEDAKLRLSWLRDFSSVDIHLEKGSRRDAVVIVVTVVEAKAAVTAASAGASGIGTSESAVYAAHFSDYDVLGTGGTLNFDLQTRVPAGGLTQEDVYSKIQYVDPSLFGSSRFFLDADVAYRDARYAFTENESFQERMWTTGLSIGRRLGQFAYISVGYEYRPVSYVSCNIRQSQQSITNSASARDGATLSLGWNADDPIFPTGGSALNAKYAEAVSGCGNVAADFRYTWALGAGYVTLHAQYPTSVGVGYGQDFTIPGSVGEVRQARWYVEPGVWSFGYSTDQELAQGIGIRGGVRLDTKIFGIVDLYIYASTRTHRGTLQ